MDWKQKRMGSVGCFGQKENIKRQSLRYGENSPIAKKLWSEFRSTWEYATEDVLPGMPAQQIPTPLLFKQLDPQRKHHKNECCRKEYCCTFSCRLRNALQAHSKSYKMANSMETRTSSNIHFHKGMVCLGVWLLSMICYLVLKISSSFAASSSSFWGFCLASFARLRSFHLTDGYSLRYSNS